MFTTRILVKSTRISSFFSCSARKCFSISVSGKYEFIVTAIRGKVGIIELNRPKQLNALNGGLQQEVLTAAREFDENSEVGCIIITGMCR
jgi:1,4-dihydroxy-2-naphthoyl-CoA synthase